MANNNFVFNNLPEFDYHRVVTFLNLPLSGAKAFIAIHRGGLDRPAFGATRIWNYPKEIEAVKDALRLSKLMTYKATLAGLKYGGAKAVIISPPLSKEKKQALLKEYSQAINYLNSHFVTGADVGIDPEDLTIMRKESKNIVGLHGDAVKFTGLGVFYSVQLVLKHLYGTEDLKDRTFAIQGVGKTGLALLKHLYPKAKKIYVADIDPVRIREIQQKYPKTEFVTPGEIHKFEVDVYSPCALSNAINLKNISSLKCKAIVGSANNQLESPHLGELLYKLGILYAPDYVVNAGGLITVVDEYEHGGNNQERVSKRVEKIKATLKEIIERSIKEKRSTNSVADQIAEEIFNNFV